MRSHGHPILFQAVRLLVISAGILAAEAAVHAATLTVTVSRPGVANKGVQPIANAQVCVSSKSGILSSNTNAQGTAVFNNAPQGPLAVTASASGFVGQSIQFTMGTLDKTESFLLQAGSGGPLCTVKPPPPPTPTLSSLVLNPTSVNGGASSQGTVGLSGAAPPGGASVTLSSNNTSAATVPPSVPVSAGANSATFTVSTSQVSSSRSVVITASAGGTTRTATLTVNAPPPLTLSSLVLNPISVNGPLSSDGTVTLSGPAPTGGASVTLSSRNTSAATVPPSVLVSAGSNSATFIVSTSLVSSSQSVIITASAGGTTRTATLTVIPQSTPPPPPANLTVIVTRTNNTLISGAAVCLTSGSIVRSAVTGITGQVTLSNITPGQITLTVSCPGFTGQSRTSTLPPSGGTTRFILSEGSGGPVCGAPPPPAATGPPAITSFDWHVNRKTPLFFEIALNFSVADSLGRPVIPTHYRVGESSDLSSAPWIALQPGVPLFQLGYRGNSLTAFGQRTVHLQVKTDNLISAVVSKSVNLQSAQTTEFRLTGLDLFGMLSFARDKGFPIRTRTVSVSQSVCPEINFDLNTRSFGITSGSLKDRAWEKVVEANLLELSTKRFTPGWRVRSIDIGRSNDTPAQQTITGAADGDGFRVTIRQNAPANPDVEPPFCLTNSFPLRAIILEGPADDMALDQAKRWKNMFPQN
jgi:Carboxypeptidase regulatory-like domain